MSDGVRTLTSTKRNTSQAASRQLTAQYTRKHTQTYTHKRIGLCGYADRLVRQVVARGHHDRQKEPLSIRGGRRIRGTTSGNWRRRRSCCRPVARVHVYLSTCVYTSIGRAVVWRVWMDRPRYSSKLMRSELRRHMPHWLTACTYWYHVTWVPVNGKSNESSRSAHAPLLPCVRRITRQMINQRNRGGYTCTYRYRTCTTDSKANKSWRSARVRTVRCVRRIIIQIISHI